MEKKRKKGSLTVPGVIESLENIGDFIRESLPPGSFTDDMLNDLQLAVDEACTNVIVHGYQGTPGEISIKLDFSDRSVIITIMDTAPPFDGNGVPEPVLTSNMQDRKPGGLGLYLMRSLMNKVSFERIDGHNVLTMEKNLEGKENGTEN